VTAWPDHGSIAAIFWSNQMDFRIVDIFTDSLAKFAGEEQKLRQEMITSVGRGKCD